MKTLLLASIATAMVAATCPAAADTTSFRCKNDLVNLSDGKASALLKCGEPVVKDSFCKPTERGTTSIVSTLPNVSPATTVINVASCVTVDDWTYNPGYGQFMTTLRFESGKLTSITYGDRVK